MSEFDIPNTFRHLTEMADEKMLAMHDAGLLDVGAIEFLHRVRAGRYAYLSFQQADRMEAIESAVLQYDAMQGANASISDDEISEMIEALNGPEQNTAWRTWNPPTFEK